MASIRIQNLDVSHEAEVGSTILETNLENDVDHLNDCGGNCACSTCKVVVVSGGEILSEQQEDERDTLDAYGWDPDDFRLSCQCVLEGEGEIVIRFPDEDEDDE